MCTPVAEGPPEKVPLGRDSRQVVTSLWLGLHPCALVARRAVGAASVHRLTGGGVG